MKKKEREKGREDVRRDAHVSDVNHVRMRRLEDVKMRRCQIDMRRWKDEDVKMRRCEDYMCRYVDVKMRKCEDAKQTPL